MNLIEANRMRRQALDTLARAYHDMILAQTMLAEVSRTYGQHRQSVAQANANEPRRT